MTRADDRLPPALLRGAAQARRPHEWRQLDKIVTDYYIEQGWDAETGVPTEATIRELELTEDAARAQ